MSVNFPEISELKTAIEQYIKTNVKTENDIESFFTFYLYFKVIDGLLNETEVDWNNKQNLIDKAKQILNHEEIENTNISSYLNILNPSIKTKYNNVQTKSKLEPKIQDFNNHLDHYISCVQKLKELFESP